MTFCFTESIFPPNSDSKSNQIDKVSHINQTNKPNITPIPEHAIVSANIDSEKTKRAKTPNPDAHTNGNRQTDPVTHPVTPIYQVDSLASTPTCDFLVGGHELGSERSILTPAGVEESRTGKLNPSVCSSTPPREAVTNRDSSKQTTGNKYTTVKIQ